MSKKFTPFPLVAGDAYVFKLMYYDHCFGFGYARVFGDGVVFEDSLPPIFDPFPAHNGTERVYMDKDLFRLVVKKGFMKGDLIEPWLRIRQCYQYNIELHCDEKNGYYAQFTNKFIEDHNARQAHAAKRRGGEYAPVSTSGLKKKN